MTNRRNHSSLEKSGTSGGHIHVVRDESAPRIVDSARALDIYKAQVFPNGASPLNRERDLLARPFQFYWGARDDVNLDGGSYYGFMESALPSVIADDGSTRMVFAIGEGPRRAPITGRQVMQRVPLDDRYAIVDETSRAENTILSRVRELPVMRTLGVTLEGTNRRSRMTIEEPLTVSSWRGDPRSSNNVYDVEDGALSHRYIARVSDLYRVSVNERDTPALALSYGGAPDNGCIGHGMVHSNGNNWYMSGTRGGPLFCMPDSVIQHGRSVDGEDNRGGMLKFLLTSAPPANPAASRVKDSSGGSGSYYHGGEDQGPLVYDGRRYQPGRGVRIVDAWFAFDPKLKASYPQCGGVAQTDGAFRMNSWATVFDPDDGDSTPPPLIPPEDPPPEVPPREPPPPEDFDDLPPAVGSGIAKNLGDGYYVDDYGYVRDANGNVVARSEEDWERIQEAQNSDTTGDDGIRDGDIVGGSGRPVPATGTVEERRPSYSGIPIPPAGSAPSGDSGSGIPGVGDGISEQDYEDAEREGIIFSVAGDIEPSKTERKIGVDYSQFPPGDHVTNTVWYDRFTYRTTQRSLRNLMRAPNTGHIQTVAKYDSANAVWDVDDNRSAYGSFDGTEGGAQTVANTVFVMPPNIDLGQTDINPSTGVTAQGFAVHRGNDNGFLGVGVPDYTTGGIHSGVKIGFDGDANFSVVDGAGSETTTGDVTHNNDFVAFRGQNRQIGVGEGVMENTSTGAYSFDGSSVASTTSINLGAGSGHIVNSHDSDDEDLWTYDDVSWSAQVVTITGAATPGITYVYINSAGSVGQQTAPLSEEQLRENIYLCRVIHTNAAGNVTSTFDNPYYILNPMTQVNEFFDLIGIVNRDVLLYPNTGGNLEVSSSGGTLFVRGGNVTTSRAAPNSVAIATDTTIDFQYIDQDSGGSGTDVTDVVPGTYDVSGTPTAIPGSSSRATIQRIYLFPSGNYRIAYGQQYYTSLSAAESAIVADTIEFVENPFIAGNGILVALMILTKGCTDLTDSTTAKIIPASALGQVFGSAGGGGSTAGVWTRDTSGDPYLYPTTSGDDILVDGVAAFGTASISQLRTINVGQSTVSGADNFDTFRVTQTIVNGSTGDQNVFSLVQSAEGTSSRSNVRGFAINVSNVATGGTVSDLFGGELIVTNNGSGSTTTRKYGLNLRLIGTAGTIGTQYGVRADIEGSATTSVGLEGRIDTGTHTYSYGVVAQGTGSITISGMHAGIYAADNVGNGSGRSVAALLKGDLGFTSNEVTRPLVRLKPDTTNKTLTLDNYNGDEMALLVEGYSSTTTGMFTDGEAFAEDGYRMNYLVIDDANASYTVNWGTYVEVDITTGTGPVTVTIEAIDNGDHTGKMIIFDVVNPNGETINVNMDTTNPDLMYELAVGYETWQSSSAGDYLKLTAGYEDRAKICCREGSGTLIEP